MNYRLHTFGWWIVIALVSFWVYAPSFFHAARADQNAYLAETADYDSWGELFSATYSYPRSRQIDVGDETLFRPLLYLVLSLERWFFHYDAGAWQMTSFLLHWGVLVSLSRVLDVISNHWLRFPLILAFSVSLASLEMVIWHHLSGYLLAFILFLEALRIFLLLVMGNDAIERKKSQLQRLSALLTIAALLNEFILLGGIYLMTLGILWPSSKNTSEQVPRLAKRCWTRLLVPLMIYGFLSLVDFLLRYRPENGWGMNGGRSFDVVATLGHAAHGVLMLAHLLMFPVWVTLVPLARTTGALVSLGNFWEGMTYQPVLSVGNLLLLLILGASWLSLSRTYGWRVKNSDEPSARNSVASLAVGLGGGLFVLYFALIVGFRQSEANVNYYLTNALYHFYPLLLFLTIMLWGLLAQPLKQQGKLAVLWAMTLLLSATLSGWCGYQFNHAVADLHRPERTYLVTLNHFVQTHRREKDFSFLVVLNEREQFGYLNVGPRHATRQVFTSATGQYFGKFIEQRDPKYFLVYTERSGLEVFTQQDLAVDRAQQILQEWSLRKERQT